jgi:hypothetical protein
MSERFTWIPLYMELADTLAGWEDRQDLLISMLEKLRAAGHTITPLKDKDEDGRTFLLEEIDPFTFFGTFNRLFLRPTATPSPSTTYTRNLLPTSTSTVWRTGAFTPNRK